MRPGNSNLVAVWLLIVSLGQANVGAAAEYASESVLGQIHAALAEIDRLDLPVIVSYSLENDQPVTNEFGVLKNDAIPAARTQIDLLSVTKSVTAISILKLVEMRKLHLTDSLSSLLKGVPEDKGSISVHQLLTHTSGFLDSCGSDHERIEKHELLACAYESRLLSEPGLRYSYSNVGYSILAAIIEELAGKSYEAFLLDDVLDGLGLHSTGYSSVIDAKRSIRSRNGIILSEASWGGQKAYWNLIGNGGLVSTADEFLRFRQALERGDVIPLDLLQLAQTAQVPEDDSGVTYYGYGVVVQERSSIGHLIWHNGGSRDFSSEWNQMKDYGISLFVAGYQTDGKSAYTAIEIFWTYLRELREQDSHSQ